MKNSNTNRKLLFETDMINCAKHLQHRYADRRNCNGYGFGHFPGYIYIAFLPFGPYKGHYHIGKTECTAVVDDNFDLDEIELQSLDKLRERFYRYRKNPSRSDEKYRGAKFVHGIRVACAEGAEKHPHSFFKEYKVSRSEIFDLSELHIDIFKKAKGQVLGRKIKHLNAEVFASYLANLGKPDKEIRELVVLPNEKKITRSYFSKYLIAGNHKSDLF